MPALPAAPDAPADTRFFPLNPPLILHACSTRETIAAGFERDADPASALSLRSEVQESDGEVGMGAECARERKREGESGLKRS